MSNFIVHVFKKLNMSNSGTNSSSTANYGTTISIESLKVIAESVGIPNLSDECGKELSEDITFKLKHIIQVRTLSY